MAESLTTPEPDLAEHLTLWDAVLQLPEPMRAAVTLFYYEDCSVAETAQILKISQGGGQDPPQPGERPASTDIHGELRCKLWINLTES